MEDYSWIIIGLILFIVTIGIAFYVRAELNYRTQLEIEALENAKLKRHLLVSLNCPYLNENRTFEGVSLSVENDFNEMLELSLQVNSTIPELMQYMDYSCSVENGMVLDVNESCPVLLNISVYPNADNLSGEYSFFVYGESK